jgi:hypothetical protein
MKRSTIPNGGPQEVEAQQETEAQQRAEAKKMLLNYYAGNPQLRTDEFKTLVAILGQIGYETSEANLLTFAQSIIDPGETKPGIRFYRLWDKDFWEAIIKLIDKDPSAERRLDKWLIQGCLGYLLYLTKIDNFPQLTIAYIRVADFEFDKRTLNDPNPIDPTRETKKHEELKRFMRGALTALFAKWLPNIWNNHRELILSNPKTLSRLFEMFALGDIETTPDIEPTTRFLIKCDRFFQEELERDQPHQRALGESVREILFILSSTPEIAKDHFKQQSRYSVYMNKIMGKYPSIVTDALDIPALSGRWIATHGAHMPHIEQDPIWDQVRSIALACAQKCPDRYTDALLSMPQTHQPPETKGRFERLSLYSLFRQAAARLFNTLTAEERETWLTPERRQHKFETFFPDPPPKIESEDIEQHEKLVIPFLVRDKMPKPGCEDTLKNILGDLLNLMWHKQERKPDEEESKQKTRFIHIYLQALMNFPSDQLAILLDKEQLETISTFLETTGDFRWSKETPLRELFRYAAVFDSLTDKQYKIIPSKTTSAWEQHAAASKMPTAKEKKQIKGHLNQLEEQLLNEQDYPFNTDLLYDWATAFLLAKKHDLPFLAPEDIIQRRAQKKANPGILPTHQLWTEWVRSITGCETKKPNVFLDTLLTDVLTLPFMSKSDRADGSGWPTVTLNKKNKKHSIEAMKALVYLIKEKKITWDKTTEAYAMWLWVHLPGDTKSNTQTLHTALGIDATTDHAFSIHPQPHPGLFYIQRTDAPHSFNPAYISLKQLLSNNSLASKDQSMKSRSATTITRSLRANLKRQKGAIQAPEATPEPRVSAAVLPKKKETLSANAISFTPSQPSLVQKANPLCLALGEEGETIGQWINSLAKQENVEQVWIHGPLGLKIIGLQHGLDWAQMLDIDRASLLVITKDQFPLNLSLPARQTTTNVREGQILFKNHHLEIGKKKTHITEVNVHNLDRYLRETNTSPFPHCRYKNYVHMDSLGNLTVPEPSILLGPLEGPMTPQNTRHVENELRLLSGILSEEEYSQLEYQLYNPQGYRLGLTT